MKICLLRHGETDWNVAGRLQGREDIPLNGLGKSQAEHCGGALRGTEWKAVITSPLLRAKQTACIVADVLGIDGVYEDNRLIERDYGKASGLTKEERAELFPDGNYDGMEDWGTLKDRVYQAVTEHANRFYTDNIIIVSHGGAINSVLAECTNHEIGSGKTRLKNTCINMLVYDKQTLRVEFYNKTYDEL